MAAPPPTKMETHVRGPDKATVAGREHPQQPASSDDNSPVRVLAGTEATEAAAAAATAAAPRPLVPFDVALLVFGAALAQSFSSGCISLFTYHVLAFELVEATRYWMYMGLTMWLQPLVGWLSDHFTLLGERRRPLFVLSVYCSSAVFLLFANVEGVTTNRGLFYSLSLVNQLCIMGAYIPLNGLLVELGKGEQDGVLLADRGERIGAVMSHATTIRSAGSFCGSVLQTLLLLGLSVPTLLWVTSVLNLVVVVIMMLTNGRLFSQRPAEEVQGDSDTHSDDEADPQVCAGPKATCKRVKESFDIHDVHSDGFSFVLVLLFVFLYNAVPDASTMYTAYLYREFQFPAVFYSFNNLVGALGSMVGAYLFSIWMQHRSSKLTNPDPRSADSGSGGGGGGGDPSDEPRPDDSNTYQGPAWQPHHDHRHHRHRWWWWRWWCPRIATSVHVLFAAGSAVWALAYLTNLMLCTGLVTDVLHIPAAVFVPIDNLIVSVCVRFAFMPTIIMAAEHAPKRFEATAFEVFSMASMAGGTFSALITSFIAEGIGISKEDNSRLYQLILLSIVSKLLTIPIGCFLPTRRSLRRSGYTIATVDDDEEEGEGEEEGGRSKTLSSQAAGRPLGRDDHSAAMSYPREGIAVVVVDGDNAAGNTPKS